MDIITDIKKGQPVNWNNKIRKLYWIICIIVSLIGLAGWPNIPFDDQATLEDHIRIVLILQNSILLGIMILAEFIFRIKSRLQDYLIIGIGVGIAASIFSLTSVDVYGAQVIMLVPIVISILFFNYRKVLFAGLLMLFTYLTLIMVLPSYQEGAPFQQFIMVIGSIVVCSFLAAGIVGRGLDIMHTEEKVILEEDRLICQKLSMGQLVRKDALTGLNNHRTFQEQLRLQVEHNDSQQLPMHLAVMDIDDFKHVNDSYGHWAGDIVLRRLGILIDEHANDDVFVARYGGEEFAIIFSGMPSNKVAEWLEALYERLERMPLPEIGELNITISVGCHRVIAGESKEIIFQRTDEALYVAKSRGKNQVVWSEAILRVASSEDSN